MALLESVSLGMVSALVIDDNTFDRRRLERLADKTTLDFYIKGVSNVQEFGRILDQEKFDVIYVDLDLAGDDGTKLLPVVRGHQTNKDAAMIMVAGDNQASVALQALRAGFSDYIEKDHLTAASLERATVNALQKSRLNRTATTAVAETKSIEAVLRSFSLSCTQQMRPMLARMLRQVRQVKSDAERAGIDAQNLIDIEQTCSRIEGFFEDLGSLASEGQLSSIVRETGSVEVARQSDDAITSEPSRQTKLTSVQSSADEDSTENVSEEST